MRRLSPKLTYDDCWYEGEQRMVVTDGPGGFNGKVCLTVGKTHDQAKRKAIRLLRRWADRLENQLANPDA